jgi:hypothetical protein
MEISRVNFVHLLDRTRRGCKKMQFWQELNLQPLEKSRKSIEWTLYGPLLEIEWIFDYP